MGTEMARRPQETTALGKLIQASSVASDADVARAVAEAQGAMMIAKRFPRDPQEAIDRIVQACTREGLARRALYAYARGGSDITGPSIRLAEAIAMEWGNLQFGLREVEQRDGESTVEAFAWDVQSNTRVTKLFQVSHVRATKQGRTKLTDPRDIYEMVANQGARRVRACILSIIPGDVIEAAVEQVNQTLSTKESLTPEKIKAMVESFEEIGVTKEMLEAQIQRRLDAITPALVVRLRSIYTSIKDGMSKPSDWFEEPQKPEAPPKPGPTAAQQAAASHFEQRAAPSTPDGMNAEELRAEILATIATLPSAKQGAYRRAMTKSLDVARIEDETDVPKLQRALSLALDWANEGGA